MLHLNLHFILLIAALVFAILATINVPSLPRLNWFPASLLCLILAFIFV